MTRRIQNKFLIWLAALLISVTSQAASLCRLVYQSESNAASIAAQYPDLASKYKKVLEWSGTDSDRPLLSIVIPAYKEELRLPPSILKIKEFLNQYPLPVEVLVIIEKSPDRTVETARAAADGDPRIQVIDNQVQRGKGYAVRSGMLRAKGRYHLFMDADLSTPLPEIINFLSYVKDHPETQVLIGDRKTNVNEEEQQRSFLRKALSSGFKYVVSKVSIKGISDTQCGFKLFDAATSQQVFSRQTLNGFAFDVEVLMLADQLKHPITSMPVKWIDDERSTVHPILDPLKMLRDLIRIRGIVDQTLLQNP
jgi:dolichyl-phosphate beta-glucosyltransferase